jgi:hypothetical protein
MKPEEFSTEVVKSGILRKEDMLVLYMHFNVVSVENKKHLPALKYISEPRVVFDNVYQGGRGSSVTSKYSVSLYLCNEVCSRDSLTYRFGGNGRIHDEDLK